MNPPAPLLRAIVGLLLATAAAVAAATGPVAGSPPTLVDGFVEMALRSSYSSRQNPVHKWIVPVNYFIVNRVGDEDLHRKMVSLHFQHLAEITGLPIRRAESAEDANFLVVLTREERINGDVPMYMAQGAAGRRENMLRHSLCLASFVTERKGPARGSIVRAVAMIPVDAARASGELASCVVEELTHALGLPNDTLRYFPSIFSRKSPHAFLSGLDYLMLKMLYDPRIKPGMSEKTVLPILRAIAGEYERDNRFVAAERTVAQSGLGSLGP